MRKEDEPSDAEWREVQERRYDKAFYAASGKINPFFRRLGKSDRAFGFQLLLLSGALVALPLTGLIDRQFLVPVCVVAVIFGIGGVSHIRTGRAARRG